MGKVYDDWGRLLEVVLQREKLRQLCYDHSTSPSYTSSDSTCSLDDVSGRIASVGQGLGDDDPLPRVESLQIIGEALPGREIQVCGYSINGTTSCNFEWVRHLEDGSFHYMDGVKQSNYLLTADDVNTFLAIQVQPLDDRNRKGEFEKVFANGQRKITCDPEMQKWIEKALNSGHASYKLSLSTQVPDTWEPAMLAIKRDRYSITCRGAIGIVVTEKFSPSTTVSIPSGSATEFSIIDIQGVEHLLRVESSSSDISGCRDTIVLTMRLFILKCALYILHKSTTKHTSISIGNLRLIHHHHRRHRHRHRL